MLGARVPLMNNQRPTRHPGFEYHRYHDKTFTLFAFFTTSSTVYFLAEYSTESSL